MSAPIEYCDSVTPEPYALALTPPSLSFEDYEVLINEWTTAEECYDEAISRHDSWKIVKAKEAWAEKLKQDRLACQLKVEALKKEKEEAERKAEEKRQKDEQLQLEAEKVVKEKAAAAEHQRLDDFAKEKKEKEDEHPWLQP